MAMEKMMELNEGWKLTVLNDCDIKEEICTSEKLASYDGIIISAQVPGDWPLDYVRHGLMDEPFFGSNYLELMNYETAHVYYTTTFVWEDKPDDLTFLYFEGIDTVADIYLNGINIGHAENMFIPHEFAASSLVKGTNELLIHFSPVVLEARKYPIAAHHTMLKYNYESLVIRKAAHCFGWDICPRIISAGLWRPVWVRRKKAARIEDIFIWLEKLEENGSACVRASYDIDINRDSIHSYELQLEGSCGDSQFCTREKLWFVHGQLRFTVDNPKLWWVRGYGDPNRYEITATLLRDGKEVDTLCWKQGLRTIDLVRDDQITGEKEAEFCFVLNGKRIYIKGTNWVPADAFHSNDINRIPAILDLVWDIGCNALRVWGGGVYENDFFYDWCDEKGILIWHDFMMACGVYPKTDRMKKQLEEEARIIVRRLRNYACIGLWAGDNECDFVGYAQTGGRMDPTENGLTRSVLPNVLYGEDMSRPYLPSSPYVSHTSYLDGHIQETPEQHLWGPRDYYKGHFYHDHHATFASEMGYHGCNSPDSIRKFIPQNFLWPEKDNPMWIYHAASPELEDSPYRYRIRLMSSQIGYLFQQTPQNLDEYAYMSQISQAEAKKYFVESFRSHKGVRTGLIWWNIMDNWPQFSDAVVDYYFCRKLAYFYIRRSQQPLCLMMDDKDGKLMLYAVNDYMDDCALRYSVTDVDSDEVVTSGQHIVPADSACTLQMIPDDEKIHFYAIRWELKNGETGINHYLQGNPPVDFKWYMNCLRKLGLDEFEGFGGGEA